MSFDQPLPLKRGLQNEFMLVPTNSEVYPQPYLVPTWAFQLWDQFPSHVRESYKVWKIGSRVAFVGLGGGNRVIRFRNTFAGKENDIGQQALIEAMQSAAESQRSNPGFVSAIADGDFDRLINLCDGADWGDCEKLSHVLSIRDWEQLDSTKGKLGFLGYPGRGASSFIAETAAGDEQWIQVVRSYMEGYQVEHFQYDSRIVQLFNEAFGGGA